EAVAAGVVQAYEPAGTRDACVPKGADMKVFKAGFGLLMLFALISPPLCITADAQYRVSLKDVLKRLEEDTDQFTKSLNYDLDHGPLNGTTTEDEINRYLHELEKAT